MNINRFFDWYNALRDRLRMGGWWLLALAGVLVIAQFSMAKIGVLTSLTTKTALGAALGYWADRTAFPYSRPHRLTGENRRWAWLRRSILMAGAMLALTLGVA